MKRKLRWLLILAILAAFVVWLEPTRVIWGWLRGEAFYDGRPTSWWVDELSHWKMVTLDVDSLGHLPRGSTIVVFLRTEDGALSWLRRLLGRAEPMKININDKQHLEGPSLLRGDQEADPVLRALVETGDDHVRRLASYGLKRIEEPGPVDDEP